MNVDNAVSQSICFCEAFDIVFHDQKVFIICRHLIVYLSHFTIMCPIIANKYIYLEAIQGYFVDLIAMHLAAWWFVVNRLVSKWSKFCRHTLLALLVRGH